MALATFDEISSPMSRWQLLSHLLHGDIHPDEKSVWLKPAYRLKFLARSLLHPVLTLNWLHYIASHPQRAQMLYAQMALPDKLQRPYLSSRFSARNALAALCYHYDAVACANPRLRRLMLTPGGVPIVNFQGKSGAAYALLLGSHSSLDKEGEITLQLCTEGMPLARMTMTVVQFEGQRALFIGGLQGPTRHLQQQKARISQVTRDCHGLFPKRLVLEAACVLGELLGIECMIAVGNHTHVYQNWRYWRKKKTSFHADYESFWLSVGGQLRPDGVCQLPLRIARKSLDDVASKKRAEYQRANGVLAKIHHQLHALK
ncbi:VirK/YbjX family protein [Symbiopectobacterium sp. RP]|uniref:VirK/YbjX family protein n=1 Tax=Symbiopectobacterium sp. RP TaxID=3248553 RepID=UPI003D2DAFD0